MLNNKKGFIFIESLVVLSITLMTVSIIVPAAIMIKKERQILKDRQIISTKLSDFIQPYIYEAKQITDDIPVYEINNRSVKMTINTEESYIKGCAIWENVKHKTETFCLYGLKKG